MSPQGYQQRAAAGVPSGIVVYEGPSQFTGAPVVAIVTGTASLSTNSKTGPMLQSYILRSDLDPISAAKADVDDAICGECPQRGPSERNSCYVNLGHGPRQVFLAYTRKAYTPFDQVSKRMRDLCLTGRLLRIGSYGDPAAVPYEVWANLVPRVGGHTAYTSSWRTCDQRFRELCVASVKYADELEEARKMGWRTYRILHGDEPLADNEFACPASEEMGHAKTCFECLACNGLSGRPTRASAAIRVHGPLYKQQRFTAVTIGAAPVHRREFST